MSKNLPVKPLDAQWNDEQWEAIYTKDTDLLISAGAGSGKTAVLVERMIQKLIHDAISIDELLVLTFTEAAAAEMKQRIRSRIEKELIQNPHNKVLSAQLNKISQANISTFHSFCNKLIKRYYYLLELDPVFKIADDIDISMIQDDVIESLFNELSESQDVQFELLSHCFNNDRDDESLKVMLLKIYELARSNPNMMQWLSGLTTLYEWDGSDLSSWIYYDEIINTMTPHLEAAMQDLEEAKAYAYDSEMMGVPHKYPLEGYEEDKRYLKRLVKSQNESYEILRDAFKNTSLSAFPRFNKKQYDEESHKLSKHARDQFKDRLTSLADQYFTYSNETLGIHFDRSIQMIEALESLVIMFHEKFSEAKLEKQILDFSDLEWCTLRLLVNEDKPTEVAFEIAKSFKEVMVDEYQDTNSMQEYIINAISKIQKEPIPVFMVGDVKQSIYRFRLAEPSIFQGKYNAFQTKCGGGKKIDLMKNYRSHKSVIDSTNFIFKQLMDVGVGEISYDEAALLKLGVCDEPDNEFNQTELHLIDKKQLMEGEPDVSVVEMEAKHLAKTIKHWVESEQMLYHRKTGQTAPIRYQDIVILMRSLTNVTVFQDVFRQYDIPLFTEQNTDLFDSIEIINVLGMLKVIDNPYQDIPVVGLMRSPLFFFSEHDLAQIRLSSKGTYFYEAILSYQKDGENELLRTKVVNFIELIERFRYLSKTIALSQLIRMIYEETMYYDFVMGLPHGYLRKANLDVFHDKALAYETLTKKGVFGFVTYIERMQTLGKHFGKAKTVTANENVVRIMSIHKSKGLEFPIVFISQIHKKFNEKDEMGNYILHKKYGIAVKYIDPILRLKQKTVAQSMVAQKIHQEMIAEEMRLLYVAMTRAKSKIIFTGVFDVEKKVQGLSEIVRTSEWLLPAAYRVKSKSYADWIIPAVLRQTNVDEEILAFIEDKRSILQDDGHWEVKVIGHYDVDVYNDLDIEKEQLVPKKIDLDKIFNPNYEFHSLVQINAKQSVSQRKAEETTPLFKGIPQAASSIAYDRPSFMQDKKMSSAQIGTALHNFMQHLPLSNQHNLKTLTEVKEELVQKEILSQKVSEVIDLTSILQFTHSHLYHQLLQAHVVKKEVPFMTLIQLENQDQSKILLQGVIDLLAEFDSEVWIVDYKTDYVKNFTTQYDELKTRYEVQMKYYAKAISEIYPYKVVKCCVYFLKVQEMITYEMTEFNN